MITENEILYFITLQDKLMKAFFIAYPDIKDFELLLDFPKIGSVLVNDDKWNFVKHGKGIKFLIEDTHSVRVVDVNSDIKNPKLIDMWRLPQYFPLCNDYEIKKLLDEMVTSGVLQKKSKNKYELQSH
ncbi:hypothetical protein F6Q07_02205 [Pectobacterium parmentieri]|uniref:DUF6896 domain-containing protein n=1 Tax=Pectobacterium parmentieri TaxID=1905730 RepID=A0A8B3FE38_PECPM|nr:hypothetical protein [Pectobacterium parmentieri]ACX88276.1 conserved hypothetical protein [Pectobacterium parmentieri WPP163]AOR58472.1 hypothetical protein A8F97_06080 [Pectobacterium parmentieri]AYH01704.1 hypothetical protein C5E26_12565 [Pectobacterium parmentieri]AYH10522.1 hypothetical protein C5E24_12925 [Pectobacterium parmentieri]AYH18767.1 hypothetical protein C5E22_09865 [Pectobacterium parmentieri]